MYLLQQNFIKYKNIFNTKKTCGSSVFHDFNITLSITLPVEVNTNISHYYNEKITKICRKRFVNVFV